MQTGVPVETKDMLVTETTVNLATRVETSEEHLLLPGEICVSIDDPKLAEDATVGVVILSGGNNLTAVEVKFADEPIRTFDRKRLIWLGPIG